MFDWVLNQPRPQSNFKITFLLSSYFSLSCYSEKMRWGRGWVLNESLKHMLYILTGETANKTVEPII